MKLQLSVPVIVASLADTQTFCAFLKLRIQILGGSLEDPGEISTTSAPSIESTTLIFLLLV